MIVGIVGANQELTVNPLQFLFGRTVKGSKLGGMTREYIRDCLVTRHLKSHARKEHGKVS